MVGGKSRDVVSISESLFTRHEKLPVFSTAAKLCRWYHLHGATAASHQSELMFTKLMILTFCYTFDGYVILQYVE